MQDDLTVVVRLSISDLARDVKKRHGLEQDLFDARLEGDTLVLAFKAEMPNSVLGRAGSAQNVARTKSNGPHLSHDDSAEGKSQGRRRRKAKRNRMKTRGWQVVAKITNSNGQTAVVYKPFVDGLFGQNLSPAQQRSKVAAILRSNGNEPTQASIEYYLQNALEYLAQANKK